MTQTRQIDIRTILKTERERCAKVAQEIAYELADGEGELYVARKIVDAIRALED
jgi:hypothetical protein